MTFGLSKIDMAEKAHYKMILLHIEDQLAKWDFFEVTRFQVR